jgi:hypothetical protein
MLEYELSVEPDENTRVVRLRLTDQDGVHCGSNQVKLAEHPPSRWEALFDTRRYVERYAGALRRDGAGTPVTAAELMDRSRGCSDRNRGLGDQNRGLDDQSRGLGDRNRGLGDRNRGLGDRNRGLGDRSRGLGDRSRGLGDQH